MAVGPGKYDDLATYVRQASKATAVVVAVIDGDKGSGFSVQVEGPLAPNLARLLRVMADEIERGAG